MLIFYVNPLYLDLYGRLDNTGFDNDFGNGCNYFTFWS